MSFRINYGYKLIISFTGRNSGFDEAADGECSTSTWYIDRDDIRKGIRKCIVKNLLKVGSPRVKPPHSLFNVVLVKFYINSMVGINRCMILVVLILIYISLPVNYSYLRIIRLSL